VGREEGKLTVEALFAHAYVGEDAIETGDLLRLTGLKLDFRLSGSLNRSIRRGEAVKVGQLIA
jgi:hypothetical protein